MQSTVRPTQTVQPSSNARPSPCQCRGDRACVPGNLAALRRLSIAARRVQTKLAIGSASDPLEREADHVAETVMRMADPAVPDPTVGETPPPPPLPVAEEPCLECEAETSAHGPLLASATPGFVGGGEAPASVHAALRPAGQPLDAATRAFFEPRFGRDFSHVRVHTGPAAAASAAAIAARAYTVGEHIAFAEGAYAPGSESGRRLLAHELTHVAQQRGTDPRVSRDIFDDAEKKLEELALQKLRDLGNKPLGPPSGYTNPLCPKEFCQPFADKTAAIADLAWAGPLILAGIAM